MLGHKYKTGSLIRLNTKGAEHLKKIFGSVSGAYQPWLITAETFSTIFPTYTIQSMSGTQYQGIKEDYLEAATD